MRTGALENGKINKLWQVAYDSGELAGAVTSLSISGLAGDTDEEYRLICRFVNGYNGAQYYHYRFNNSSTANSYGWQDLSGINTTGAASKGATNALLGVECAALNEIAMMDCIIHAKSGYVRTLLQKDINGISGTTVTGIKIKGQSWNNTADEITSIDFYGYEANGIGIGSRIILLKKVKLTTGLKTGKLNIQGSIKGTWETIYSNTLASAATSVTISNLTGNSDVLYRLRMRVVNGYVGTITVAIRPNNDTGANYGYQRIYGENTTKAASRDTGNDKIYTLNTSNTSVAYAEELFYAKAGYVRTFLSQDVENAIETTIGDIVLKGQSWNNTADEITSLVIYANQANGLGIGTEIILERLNL